MKYRLPLITALVFAALYAAFALSSPLIWNSPDETGVAFFARQAGTTGRLWVFEPYNVIANELVHPRSIISVDAHLVPGSFYGAMWVVGTFYRLIGTFAFAIVTPLFTGLAALVLYYLIRRQRGEGIAYIAELLFLAHPAVWYFSSRGLFPNLLFIDFALLGVAAFYLRPWQRIVKGRGSVFGTLIDDAIGTILLAIAFAIRPTEFIWLGPLLIVWLYRSRKHLTVARVVACVVVAAFFAALLGMTNASLYGSPTSFGYTVGAELPGVSVPALGQGSRLPAALTAPRPYLLPFGFHPKAAFFNLWHYVVAFEWWYTLPALIGIFLFPRRQARRLLLSLGFVTVVLGVYYGSGIFNDSTIPGLTVGSSYLRYFLPILLLTIPFAAESLWRIGSVPDKKMRTAAIAAVTAAMLALNVWTVWFRSPESLAPMHATLVHYAEVKKEVLALTAKKDVIIVERSDKIFFPDRRVMVDVRDPKTMDAIPRLALLADIYYYGITIADAEYPHIQDELFKRHLQMGRVKTFGSETLYAITPRQ